MSHLQLSWVKTHAEEVWMKLFHAGAEENQGLVLRDELGQVYGEGRCDSQVSCLESPAVLRSDVSCEDAASSTQSKITTWEAGWNITNAIQGIFVLGLPYALLQSGYMGLLLLVFAAVICSYTGKILVSCLYEEDESGHSVRVRHTYEDIANTCCRHICPYIGGKVVNAAQVVELVMTCILYLVISSNLMCHSLFFFSLTPATCSTITFLTLVPCMVIRDLRVVSHLSLFCSLAQFLITFIVIGYCLCQSPQWAQSNVGGLSAVAVDFDGFQVAVGVIIFSYTSQIYLPTLEESMMDRQDFCSMMDWTHALACILKTAFSVVAFLTWGEETKEVITDNLPTALRMVVNLCLLAKAMLSYPLPFYAAAEILQTGVLKLESSAGRQTLLVRGSLLILTLIMALYVPRFSLLMGLTGSVTGAVMSLVLPALFHLQLKWTQLDISRKLLDLFILFLGCFCSISGVICSIKGIIKAFEKDR
ncbi:vesicular inhibitory amino acid transporter [Myxocyprinus asiaticus]|uniref:vesicular inhibitory amino acid transporter n=1 Tax=Myxocyprinus asiaticus TaxID=70543 RepID=UPI002221E8F0|nr:vesicular inhibitory amino acid transporter [Myxocyprinus asiaticus]